MTIKLTLVAWLAFNSRMAQAADEAIDFNQDVRPILSENCFYCHGQDGNKREGDLRLDVRSDAIDRGAIVPGDVADSELIRRIRSADPDTLMPPPDSNRTLSDEQKATLERWIASGATYEQHWAFEPPKRPALPEVGDQTWIRNPVDRFVLSTLEARGMSPSAEADRATLMKRLHADLIGLPPEPEELDAFVASDDPEAYEKLVSKLLDSPAYGERMALPWLDAARYADSNGFQQDGDTWQWHWRDWLVRALNENLSFDQFTTWQLAGDLLPNATLDQKIASGFNRNHLLNGEGGAIAEEQRFVILFDRIDTTATTWLGLTMACAQCHDHKYDPITQRDYYSLMHAFNQVPETGTPQRFSKRIRVAAPFVEILTDENHAKIADFEKRIAELEPEWNQWVDAAFIGWRAGILADGKPSDGKFLPESLLKLLAKADADRSQSDKAAIDSALRNHFKEKIVPTFGDVVPGATKLVTLKEQLKEYRNDQIARVMIMSDDRNRDTHILDRGEYLKPTEKVEFATPAFLPAIADTLPRNRLGLAQWLVSDDHPLTARVQVNRIWQHYFGQGIVKTSEDFGVQSEYPIHLPLLDWLAVEFREGGWDMKAVHRLIVTSATYRQSSRVTPELLSLDAENKFYARASRFRMPSMVLRDWALASSELLNEQLGGAPVYPYQPEGIWESLAITKERDFTYPSSAGSDLYRRSLYTFWRRTVGPANMFDASNRQSCRVRMTTTSTPLHALTTLNDPTWAEASRVLAERALHKSTKIEDAIAYAFKRVLSRNAKPTELNKLKYAFDKQIELYRDHLDDAVKLVSVGAAARDEKLDVVQHAALSGVCLAIFNLDEAICRQ